MHSMIDWNKDGYTTLNYKYKNFLELEGTRKINRYNAFVLQYLLV